MFTLIKFLLSIRLSLQQNFFFFLHTMKYQKKYAISNNKQLSNNHVPICRFHILAKVLAYLIYNNVLICKN